MPTRNEVCQYSIYHHGPRDLYKHSLEALVPFSSVYLALANQNLFNSHVWAPS